MKKHEYHSIASEIQFLFEDVIKVNVLTHAKAFQQHRAADFMEAVRQCEEFALDVLADLPQGSDIRFDPEAITVPEGYQNAWEELNRSGILQMLAPAQYGGRNFPETVKIAIQEILLSANPSFYLYLMLTLEVANLIDQYGDQQLKDDFCQPLFKGQWTGTFSFTEPLTDSDWDAIEAIAREEDDGFSINATKTFIVAGSHDIAENLVHLVLSLVRLPGSDEHQLAWFIVPNRSDQRGGERQSNHLAVESCHDTIGLNGIPICTISFGKSGRTMGQLLCVTGNTEGDLYKTFNGVRTQMALHGVALSGQGYQQTLHFACREEKQTSIDGSRKGRTAPLINYPHIADHIMYMKAVSEGIRGAVYSIAFFRDCSIHGGEEQREFFADLTDLYTGILKVHATTSGLESISKGIQVFGKLAYTSENITARNYRNLQAATLFGGTNEFVAQELLDKMVHTKKGELIDSLIRQFSSADVNAAKSEPMMEAIRVWQDYIGGIIVLVDDLKKESSERKASEDVDPRLSGLWASRIVKLLGDLIICYHLINQGLEAENKLTGLEVNFFNLQQEVSRVPAAMSWYDRILAAEYYALNILSENEGNIRIIQRNASSALEAFFSPHADR